MKRNRVGVQLLIVALGTLGVAAMNPAGVWQNKTAQKMAQTANAFTATLTSEQKQQLQFDFANAERENWHFVPYTRKGLPLKSLTPAQRLKGMALLKTAMSTQGASKVTTIMSLENVLKAMENGNPGRDPDGYYFSLFGTPPADSAADVTTTWGWRFEGHHCALNFTVVKGKLLADSPMFMGSNPAEVRGQDYGDVKMGTRARKDEEEAARVLLNLLTPEQQTKAIFAKDAFPDIISFDSKTASPLSPEGLPASAMTKEQKAMLGKLIDVYLGNVTTDLAKTRREKMQKAGKDKITFGWAGSTERNKGHYYRVQGPTFLIEYDNTQNNANHIHSVWRDFGSDFGHDYLREHLSSDHKTR
jgi:hypothetical protein